MSVARSSLVFAFGTLLSRLSGLVRDRVIAATFGTSPLITAFWLAYRLPNMLRELLAEGALGSAFTKVYSSVSVEDKARAQKLLVEMLLLMTLVSVLVCTIGALLAPWLVDLFLLTAKPSADTELIRKTTVGLTRLLFPYLGLMVIGAISMGALHQKGGKGFFVTSASPISYNVITILGAIWFVGVARATFPPWVEDAIAEPGIVGFALFVLLGGLAQMVIQVGALRGRLVEAWRDWRVRFPWSPDLKKVLVLMGPMVLAASSGQINVLVNTTFTMGTDDAAVNWLNYALRLLLFPIGMFGVAISSAVLPALTRSLTKAGGKVDAQASSEIQNAFELVLWLMAPSFALYVVNDLAVVRFLFESGRFTLHDSEQTAAALYAYSFSLMGYGLMKVLTSFYFALDRTGYALRVSLFSIVTNFVVNYLFVDRYGHVGIAWGYSITLSLSIALLIFGMRGQGVAVKWSRFFRSMALLVFAIGLAIAVQKLLVGAIASTGLLEQLSVFRGNGLVLGICGVATATVFAILGLATLRLAPRAALAKLKSRRR